MPAAATTALVRTPDPVTAPRVADSVALEDDGKHQQHEYVVRRLFAFNDVAFTAPRPLRRLAALKALVALHTGVEPEFQTLRPLQVYVTVLSSGQSPSAVATHHGSAQPESRRSLQYTLHSNQCPADLCRSIERDSGIPVHQQCLVVGEQQLALGRMALLCEYSANGRDLHLNLALQHDAAAGTVDANCQQMSPGRGAQRRVRAISLQWMDQTSSVVQLHPATATLRGVREELYARYGLSAAAYNFTFNGRVLCGLDDASVASIVGAPCPSSGGDGSSRGGRGTGMPQLRLVPSACAVFFDPIGTTAAANAADQDYHRTSCRGGRCQPMTMWQHDARRHSVARHRQTQQQQRCQRQRRRRRRRGRVASAISRSLRQRG